jgi:hypothetical protein
MGVGVGWSHKGETFFERLASSGTALFLVPSDAFSVVKATTYGWLIRSACKAKSCYSPPKPAMRGCLMLRTSSPHGWPGMGTPTRSKSRTPRPPSQSVGKGHYRIEGIRIRLHGSGYRAGDHRFHPTHLSWL